jgi:hypothetical protein
MIDPYEIEIEDGISESVKASNSIAFEMVAVESFAEEQKFTKNKDNKTIAEIAIAENKNQEDLYYLKSVLVSTGWNKNDDVFNPEEMWIARNTPEDKPFNLEHNQDIIIGHITGCYPASEDGSPIQSDTPPENYNIITSAVIYKEWENQEKKAQIENICSEIPNGSWFVSMEALFSNFDYAINDKTKTRIVARNNQTAFLTKYLKAYGGSGIYGDQKIGRVLRNIIFSGKGLVRKPANPDSVIFQTEAQIKDLGYKSLETPEVKEIILMAESIVEKSEATEVISDVSLVVENTTKLEAELNDAVTKASLMQQELVKATEELQKMKNEKKQSDRLSLVSEKLGMSKVEAEEVTSLLDKLEDSSFAGFIAKQSEYLSKKMSEYEADAKKMAQSEMPKEKDTEEETDTTVCSKCGQSIGKKAMAEEDTAENIATEETLESAEVKEGADLNFSDVKSDPVQAVASQIASYLGVELGNLKNNEE